MLERTNKEKAKGGRKNGEKRQERRYRWRGEKKVREKTEKEV